VGWPDFFLQVLARVTFLPHLWHIKHTNNDDMSQQFSHQMTKEQAVNHKNYLSTEYASTRIYYVGPYVAPGTTSCEQIMMKFGEWLVMLQEVGGSWVPVKASNMMTGTDYKNPYTWFEKKLAKA
jgi:hypothetical protein